MSKLPKLCSNYTQACTLAKPGGCLYKVPWGMPQVCAPQGAQILYWNHISLGEYPALTPRYWFAYLPAYYRGGMAKRYEACLLYGENQDYHCHCPPKTLIKFLETGGTVTHPLQVLHSLQWHQPWKDERALCSSSRPRLPILHSHATWCCSGRGVRP